MNRRARDALVGVCFLAVVAVAVLATLLRHRSLGPSFTVARCLQNISECRAEAYLDLSGVYVSGTQAWGQPGCASRLELQASSGGPPGRIRVCTARTLPAIEVAVHPDSPVEVRARGHFVRDHFAASAVFVVAPELTRRQPN